jgi:hypothetical protein
VQRHLRGDPRQRLHQEVSGTHPGFDCAEGVLDRLASLPHFLRVLVEPALHRFEHMLMLPAGEPRPEIEVSSTSLRMENSMNDTTNIRPLRQHMFEDALRSTRDSVTVILTK